MKLILILTLLTSLVSHAKTSPHGFYANGSLEDAECLPESGEGYIQLLRDMDRIWGTEEIITMIRDTAAEMNTLYPDRDRLQVEDIAAKHGGRIEGHGSHTNGLDVDIQFYKKNGVEHDPIKTGEDYAPSMVTAGKVSDNFDVERNWEVMKTLHKHADIQRIFIDQKLKNQLCSYAKEKGEIQKYASVLRSLRHETNHQDHFHVRLRCPKDAKSCTPQADPSPGTGCP